MSNLKCNEPTSYINKTLSCGFDIEFTNICYAVQIRPSLLNAETKVILNDVSGEFRKKQLVAILGCSGSGKSTLLNILSGYKTNGYNGSISINGNSKINLKLFRRQISYILQDDILQPLLTVQESMEFAMKFLHSGIKIGHQKKILIEEILKILMLYEKRLTMEKYLSGGERKRLSIALELIRDPKVMFLDEPTTGLDVVSTNQVVSTMKKLAFSGKTIVCTIHQLSASNLILFDSLYILTPSGQCMYNGSPSHLIKYLNNFGLYCPLYHNPADYVIDVSRGLFGNKVDMLVDSLKKIKKSLMYDEENCCLKNAEVLRTAIELSDPIIHTSYTTQCSIIFSRLFLIAKRDKFLTNARFMVHIFLACTFGFAYYDIGHNLSYSLDNVAMMYFCLLQCVYTSAYTLAMKLPMELFVVRREHFNRWYSLGPYYLCVIILDLPLQVFSISIYSILIYILTGQPFEYFRLLMFLLMIITTTLFSQSLGMFISVIFDNFVVIIVTINLVLLPWVMFSGVFLRIRDTSKLYRWIYDYSFLKRSIQGILHSIYGFNRPSSDCVVEYCYYRSPKELLKDIDMPENNYWSNILFIATLYLIMKILTYVVLKYRIRINK
ncbi:ATP-binding cassette subfamily G member 4-like [Daktulosphaira vitifoliae]|uniref:ATP-binding cassette subfamily G member 4-like n=1 Tax=Daktulosphaira vitifoliae TaxID=58002 RepID=UPI0021AAB954|nr:ATP-binding cassette subfamily G member 4-like [Daktulosphaira vitifoliae]